MSDPFQGNFLPVSCVLNNLKSLEILMILKESSAISEVICASNQLHMLYKDIRNTKGGKGDGRPAA